MSPATGFAQNNAACTSLLRPSRGSTTCENARILLTQVLLLNLAHCVTGYVISDEDPLGLLVLGELVRECGLNTFLIELCTRLRRNHGNHTLAEVGMRSADHRALSHARDRLDRSLNFGRVDIVAARDDEILGASDNVGVALLINVPEVARDEEAVVAELFLGLLGHPPVTLEHIGAADLNHADLALW